MPTDWTSSIFLCVKNYKHCNFMIHWGYICELPEIHTVKIPCRLISLVWLWNFYHNFPPRINGSIYRELGIIRYQNSCDQLHVFHSGILFLNFLIYTYLQSNRSTLPPWFVHQCLWQCGEGGGKLQYSITGNFCSQTFMVTRWGWHCIGVWLSVCVCACTCSCMRAM